MPLLDKIEEEIQILESIYSEEGVVQEYPTLIPPSNNQVMCCLKILPNTAGELEKVSVYLRTRFYFTDQVILLYLKPKFYSTHLILQRCSWCRPVV